MANLSVGIQGEELTRCLNNSGAKIVITLDLFAQNLYSVVKDTGVKTVIFHSVFGLGKKIPMEKDTETSGLSGTTCFNRESARAGSGDFWGRLAVLQYTSGSTGTPKAATLTHSNIVASVLQSVTWSTLATILE